MGKTKIVKYKDPETNTEAMVLLPVETPSEYASEGVLISVDFSTLYPLPFARQLQEALWARGFVMASDFETPGADSLIRQAIQQVLRITIEDIKQHAKKGVIHNGH